MLTFTKLSFDTAPTLWRPRLDVRFLLDKVILQVNVKTIKAQLIWPTGVKQDILIHRPVRKQPWTNAELTSTMKIRG